MAQRFASLTSPGGGSLGAGACAWGRVRSGHGQRAGAVLGACGWRGGGRRGRAARLLSGRRGVRRGRVARGRGDPGARRGAARPRRAAARPNRPRSGVRAARRSSGRRGRARAAAGELAAGVQIVPPPPPPPFRTKWTRRVLHPVLIGHAAESRRRAGGGRADRARGHGVGCAAVARRGARGGFRGRQLLLALRGVRRRAQVPARPPPPPFRTNRTRRVPHPVLIGHAASLTPY